MNFPISWDFHWKNHCWAHSLKFACEITAYIAGNCVLCCFNSEFTKKINKITYKTDKNANIFVSMIWVQWFHMKILNCVYFHNRMIPFFHDFVNKKWFWYLYEFSLRQAFLSFFFSNPFYLPSFTQEYIKTEIIKLFLRVKTICGVLSIFITDRIYQNYDRN
jgi:hypothetical protein